MNVIHNIKDYLISYYVCITLLLSANRPIKIKNIYFVNDCECEKGHIY